MGLGWETGFEGRNRPHCGRMAVRREWGRVRRRSLCRHGGDFARRVAREAQDRDPDRTGPEIQFLVARGVRPEGGGIR